MCVCLHLCNISHAAFSPSYKPEINRFLQLPDGSDVVSQCTSPSLSLIQLQRPSSKEQLRYPDSEQKGKKILFRGEGAQDADETLQESCSAFLEAKGPKMPL